MERAFVVIPEGDLFYIMQVCPDALLSASGSCAFALYCDCQHSDAGPLWQMRGYFKREFEAKRRADALQDQFERDVQRQRGVIERRRAREREAMARPGPETGISDDDVPC